MNEKPGKAVRIIGWIIVVTIFLGGFFKVQRLPAASLLILISALVYLFFYLPFWLPQAWHEKKERIFIIVQFVFTFLFILWQTFKMQHWPGGAELGNIIFISGICILVPVSLVKFYRFGRNSFYKFNNLVFLFYLVASMQTNLMRLSETTIGANAISLSAGQVEYGYDRIKLRSRYLYNAFDQVNDKEQNVFYQKSKHLKEYTDSVERYLHGFKVNIIKNVDGRPDINFDTIHISEANGLVNSSVPTDIIIGSNPDSPLKGRYTGQELKSVVNQYRDSALKYVNDEDRVFVASGINLNTDDVNNDGEKQSWVTYNFFAVPAISVLVTLTKLEYEVKNAEANVLTNLLSNASKGIKDSSLVTKVADLGYKLDKEKKSEEISALQKDKELSQLKLEAESQEIAGKNKAIVWFVIILLSVGIMIFYIVRSNVMRRRMNRQLQEQKKMIEDQKALVEEKNKEVLDSIMYAKRLQDAILPPLGIIRKYLPESFVLYKPKDIVAGDFYWMERSPLNTVDEAGEVILIAAADCTGHGVPGALVSVVCSNALNRTVKEFKITQTGKILDKVRELVLETFEKSESEVKDGMDISLCCINTKTREVEWSGAYNPLWYVQNNEVKEIVPDKQPIGMHDHSKPFSTHSLKLQKGDIIYLFTDGYADQFGGPKGKKFKYKQMQEKIMAISSMDMDKQKEVLNETIESWKGDLEQIDDVLIIGIRI